MGSKRKHVKVFRLKTCTIALKKSMNYLISVIKTDKN